MAFAIAILVQLRQPGAVFLTVAVALASWLFMMTTVLCYKLDYIGQTRQAQAFSGAHLAMCVIAFGVFPLGGTLYIMLAVGETLLFGAALRSCLMHWRSSEYTLFWRHATAW